MAERKKCKIFSGDYTTLGFITVQIPKWFKYGQGRAKSLSLSHKGRVCLFSFELARFSIYSRITCLSYQICPFPFGKLDFMFFLPCILQKP